MIDVHLCPECGCALPHTDSAEKIRHEVLVQDKIRAGKAYVRFYATDLVPPVSISVQYGAWDA